MNYKELKEYIDSNDIDELLKKIICSDDIKDEKKRYHLLLDQLYPNNENGDFHFVSSPGRVEIGGNHTDHQHGHVVAATISYDNVCVFTKSNDTRIVYSDPKLGTVDIDIKDTSYKKEEENTSASIIRGIANRLKELGYKVGGFRAVCDSRVLIGSSLSSSACFEVMIVEIFSYLYNESKINVVERALISQYSENKYFGKACGLLDQSTISAGGFVTIDFKNPENPTIESFDFSFDKYGYDFFVVDTKGTHANLSNDYSAMPLECESVAKELGKEVLADTNIDDFYKNIRSIRDNLKNDRALLRALHFYGEDERAIKQKEAIKNKDIDTLLKLMNESGRSSYMYLQNVNLPSNVKTQNIALGLSATDLFLKGKGAFRIQGGGFEGTFMAIVPSDLSNSYIELMNRLYGDGSVIMAKIRPFGTKIII